LTEGRGYKQFAYLKAAWSIDLLTENVSQIFKKKGKTGLMALKGIGDKMSEAIIKIIASSEEVAGDLD
jgi:DNA polymerase/3'-5' exonuclease PolX